MVRETFGLAPLAPPVVEMILDTSADEDDDVDDKDDDVDPNTFVLVAGDLLGLDDYLLQVRRILDQKSHNVVDMLESENTDFVVGVKSILMMAPAQLLYVEYNNL